MKGGIRKQMWKPITLNRNENQWNDQRRAYQTYNPNNRQINRERLVRDPMTYKLKNNK
jgi:hypothetical protein